MISASSPKSSFNLLSCYVMYHVVCVLGLMTTITVPKVSLYDRTQTLLVFTQITSGGKVCPLAAKFPVYVLTAGNFVRWQLLMAI